MTRYLQRLVARLPNPQGAERIVALNSSLLIGVDETTEGAVIILRDITAEREAENQRLRHQITPPLEMPNTTKAVYKLKSAISYAFRKDVPLNLVKVVLVIDN